MLQAAKRFASLTVSQSGAAASLVGMDCEGAGDAASKKAKFNDEGDVDCGGGGLI